MSAWAEVAVLTLVWLSVFGTWWFSASSAGQ
jgi:hypothetical protein